MLALNDVRYYSYKQSSIQYSKRMSVKQASKLPNNIKISQFGLTFLKQLPAELQDLEQSNQTKPNFYMNATPLQRRGSGVNFCAFANQTQTLLKRQTFSLSHLRSQGPQTSQSKRKLQLHYNNWLSEQKLLHHKIADSQSRLQQAKYSEYDWRTVSSSLKERSQNILGEWSQAYLGRAIRKKDKLGKLLARKYPKRQGP